MNVPVFTLPNYCYRCKVVRVLDGDTIDVDIDLGFNITARKRLRFLEMNAWESRGEEKSKGVIATLFMKKLLDTCDEVVVQTVMDAKGKYGRVLAWVWVLKDEKVLCANKVMVDEGHAR
jgi:micrococcal nuclease